MPVCALVADVSAQDTGDGVGLAKAIHAQNPDSQCMLIVGEESSETLYSARHEPWLRIVPKPISMLQFSADVVDAIEHSQAGDRTGC